MLTRLILNADDFGLTAGINQAVAELHDLGAITSATLMANGRAFVDAVAVAQSRPSLGVGCHVVLIDGSPISPPHTIPTLLGSDGCHFRPSLNRFLLAAVGGQISEQDIYREAMAQVERLQQHGIQPTHLDSHKHTHILPQVTRPLLAVAERCGIRAIRNPFEPSWSLDQDNNPLLRRIQLRALRRMLPGFLARPQFENRVVATTNGTAGIAATGTLNSTALARLLSALPSHGIWEIVCHPGYNDGDLATTRTRLRSTREIERQAIASTFSASFREMAHLPDVQLINYGDISR